eukprot:scaffold5152_cov56-Phaeocystis_antarctica.AAC.1
MVKRSESAALEAARPSTKGGGWAPSGWASPWERRAAQSRQARPEEAQAPGWGTAKGALCTAKLTLTLTLTLTKAPFGSFGHAARASGS